MAQDDDLKFRLPKEWKQRLEQIGKSEGLKGADMCRRAIKNFLSPNRYELAQNDRPMPALRLDATQKTRISKAQVDDLKARGNGEHGDLSNMARMAVWEFIPPNNEQESKRKPPSSPKAPLGEKTMYFAQEIAEIIGLSANVINGFEAKGCKFFQGKTTIEWVREFIDQATGT